VSKIGREIRDRTWVKLYGSSKEGAGGTAKKKLYRTGF